MIVESIQNVRKIYEKCGSLPCLIVLRSWLLGRCHTNWHSLIERILARFEILQSKMGADVFVAGKEMSSSELQGRRMSKLRILSAKALHRRKLTLLNHYLCLDKAFPSILKPILSRSLTNFGRPRMFLSKRSLACRYGNKMAKSITYKVRDDGNLTL